MKKIISILLLFIASFSFSQQSTKEQQGITNNTLTVISNTLNTISASVDGLEVYQRYVNGKLDSLKNNIVTHTYALVSSSVTTSGNVATGERVVIFRTSSDFVGTVDAIALDGNDVITFSADQSGALPQINYVISAGSIRIRKMK